MHWLGVALTLLMGAFQPRSKSLRESALEIYEEIMFKSRRSIVLLMIAFAAVVFFCGGFFISLIQATNHYDRTGELAFTASIGAGLILMAISIITFAVVFIWAWPGLKARRQAHHREEQHERDRERKKASLDEALGMLVSDFANDRRARKQARHQRRQARAEAAAAYRRQRKESSSESPVRH